jgi:hypothetical protein
VNPNLTRPGFGDRALLDSEWFTELANDSCAHRGLLVSVSTQDCGRQPTTPRVEGPAVDGPSDQEIRGMRPPKKQENPAARVGGERRRRDASPESGSSLPVMAGRHGPHMARLRAIATSHAQFDDLTE